MLQMYFFLNHFQYYTFCLCFVKVIMKRANITTVNRLSFLKWNFRHLREIRRRKLSMIFYIYDHDKRPLFHIVGWEPEGRIVHGHSSCWEIMLGRTSWCSVGVGGSGGRVLLFCKKCHFCHLLPFAKVGQNTP